MQRAAFDLIGIGADADDQRPWLWMASWPIDRFPLRRDFEASPKWEPGQEEYAFVRVEGDGVHEIPVGPVHAGIIEPGHFRFQVVGEKVLRLEERLGYAHKGIEKRFESMTIVDGASARRTHLGRQHGGLCLGLRAGGRERSPESSPRRGPRGCARCASSASASPITWATSAHLGNDGGFAFGLAQFSRLRRTCCATNLAAFGHRLLMDCVVPGGVARDLETAQALAMRDAVRAACARDSRAARHLRRARGTAGPLPHLRRGRRRRSRRKLGHARAWPGGRADSALDLRCDFPCAPYDALGVRKIATAANGDVAARVAVRFDEAFESLRLIDAIVARLLDPRSPATCARRCPTSRAQRLGVGLRRRLARAGAHRARMRARAATIRRCHPHDPSWSNWPVLEHAVIGNIVPDFPLINKSFNLSYSGHDL